MPKDDAPFFTNPVTKVTPAKASVLPNMDEPTPGGVYIVNGQVVDAEGTPLKGWSVVDGEAVKDGG